MAEISQIHKPLKIQLDLSEELRDAFNAAYLLNVRWNLNINSEANLSGNATSQGGNVQNATPTQSNEILCDIDLPSGNNLCTGAYQSRETSEVYYEVWNDEDNHSLWVYGTESQSCRKVYEGLCLGFHFEPQYHLPAHRCALFVIYDSDGSGNRTIKNKFYTFTDGIEWQKFIDVESAIATDSYNPISFPYFQTSYPYCDPCEFIQLGIRPPQSCPIVLPFDDDTDLQFYEDTPESNNLLRKMWWFATAFGDIFGRKSVISPYSTPVYLDGGDCNLNSDALKCFRLQLDAGSPLVDKIYVYFSNDGINFFQYDVIHKWEDCSSPPTSNFWERTIALHNYYAPATPCAPIGCFPTFTYTWDLAQSPPLDFTSASITIDGVTYTENSLAGFHGLIMWLNSLNKGTFQNNSDVISTSSASIIYGDLVINNSPHETFTPVIAEADQCGTANTFIYQFCGNKQCIPVATTEVERIFDDLPIASVSQTMIDDKLSMSNNLLGYDNFICPIENIAITTVQDAPQCETELVTITIDAVVQQFYDFSVNNPVYQLANLTTIAFGGLGTSGKFENEVVSSYGQQLLNESKNFLGGFRATNFKTAAQQYRINDLTTPVLPTNVDYNSSTKSMMQDVEGGNYFIQRFKFKVPKGNYIFEIYSHLATGFNDCVGTSTYFFGTIPKTTYDTAIGNISTAEVNKNVREILINACDGDVEISDYIVIADLTKPKTSISISSDAEAACGYLKEKTTNIPVELAELHINTIVQVQSFGTDANGFYFATDSADFIVHLNLLNPNSCLAVEAHAGGNSITEKQLSTVNVFVDNPTGDLSSESFNSCGHELIEGYVKDCDGNAIAGIPVLLTRTGSYAITDIDGHYTLLAHDNANIFSQTGQTRKQENVDSVLISQVGVCIFSQCGDCNTCIPTQHVTFINSCFHCDTQSPPTTPIDIYDFTLTVISGARSGVKTGGTYAISIIGYDYLDRNNSAQRIGFFTVPTIQSNGVFAPYHFDWAATLPLNLPSWVKKIRFAVTANKYDFLLSWVANKIEFVDAAGNITAPSIAANIKVYIDDLTTFNTQNNLNTTTSYQWVAGDMIRFITNGDGTLYDTASNGGLIDLPISATVNGTVLLIPFDSRLIGLIANAVFEIYRVPVCTTEAVYLEQCPSIPVLFNESTQSYEPIITSGTIPFFDTYWFYRAIPITDKNNIYYIFVAPHPFEHFAPSDFWGTAVSGSNVIRLFSTGRPFVRNENQRQTWYLDDVQYSDNLLQDGNINGLATWRTENKKSYVVQGAGGIVATKAQTGLFFALCENNWFVANISQNLLLITADGNVQANPDYLGNKQQKIGNIYGCDLRDTNTIIFHEEWLTFADAKRSAWCKSNYQTVWDITEENDQSSGGTKSYWIEKFKQISDLRNENQFDDSFMFLHSAYDPKTNEVLITSFARINSPSEIAYGTDARDYSIASNETISFSLSGFWSGNYSFTPEQMIDFDSGKDGVQLLAFKNGKPYIHHKIKTIGITFNNFFGVQYEPVIKFVFNGGDGKNLIQKRFLAMRILCKESLFYSDEIFTQAFQFSQLGIEESQFGEQYSEVAFLCDINTLNSQGISALIDGDSLFSAWIKIRLLIDPNNIAKYFELSGINLSAVESF